MKGVRAAVTRLRSARRCATALVIVHAISAAPAAPQALTVAPNRLYVEALGSGLVYSLNYERDLHEHVNVRVGFGGLPIQGVQYVVGFGMIGTALGSRRHSLRLAAGGGLLYAIDVWVLEVANAVYGYGAASVGYQFQPRKRGLMLRASFTPIFFPSVAAWGGLSVGWAF